MPFRRSRIPGAVRMMSPGPRRPNLPGKLWPNNIGPDYTNYSMGLNDGVSDEYGKIANTGEPLWEYTDVRTVSCFFKTDLVGVCHLACNIQAGSPYRGWDLFSNSGSIQIFIANTNSTNLLYTGTVDSSFNDDAWHCAIVTFNSDGTPVAADIEIDVDDVNYSDTVFDDSPLSATTVNTDSRYAIGARYDITTGAAAHGKMRWGQTAVWSKVLSTAEKSAVYAGRPSNNGGNFLDLTTHAASANLIAYHEPRSLATTVPDLSVGAEDMAFLNIADANFDASDLP